MRRLILVLFAAMLIAPAALADRRAAGDGALAVSSASARLITVKGSGLIFGHIDQGTVTVLSYDAADTSAPQITGAVPRIVGNAVVYSGADIRFLFPNGRYSLRFEGTGIDISAVGKGSIAAFGLGTLRDGTLSANGSDPQPLGVLGTATSFGVGGSPKTPASPGVTASFAKGSSQR
jgi:hypothetical protein